MNGVAASLDLRPNSSLGVGLSVSSIELVDFCTQPGRATQILVPLMPDAPGISSSLLSGSSSIPPWPFIHTHAHTHTHTHTHKRRKTAEREKEEGKEGLR